MERLRQLGKFRNSLRGRLMLWFGGLSLATLLGVGFYVGRIATGELAQFGGESLYISTQSAAALLSTNLREREQEIGLMARSVLFTQGRLNTENVRRALELRKTAHKEYAWLGIADPAGRVIQATGGLLLNEQVGQRPWFKAGAQAPFMGDVHEAVLLAKRLPRQTPGEPLRFIDFAAPILDERGQLKGVLGSHVHWSWVTDTVESAVASRTPHQQIEVLIADRAGNVLYPYRHVGQLQMPERLQPNAPFERLRWSDGVDYLTSTMTVNLSTNLDLGWRIVLRQPVDVAMEPVQALRNRLLLLGLGAGLLFTAMAYYFATQVSRPIEQLARAARRIELRDGSPVYPGDEQAREIRQLSRSFQSMTESLLQREKELSELNATLEGQVAERTQALHQANQELARLATIDALTGLHNRRWFDEKLHEHHGSLMRQGRPFALLVIDADHFKRINDTHGHVVGDAVLRQLARLLLQSVRATDFVARFGGEEFVVLLPDTTQASDGMLVAENIRSTVEGSIFPSVLNVTVSIGLGLSNAADTHETSVFLRADRGVYLAKQQGRNRIVLVQD